MAINKINDLLLFSTGTKIAYDINVKYYNDTHFVWCTEAFDSLLQPGTSNPKTICNRLLKQIVSKDDHAEEIKNNKAGILKGARIKYEESIITDIQYREIQSRISCSELSDYYPVIYLINKRLVKKRLQKVSPKDCANLASVEYIINDLKSSEFNIIKVKDLLFDIVSTD